MILKKYLVVIMTFGYMLNATNLPLEKIITTEIAIGEWAVFDFPFVIKEASPTSFKSKYDVEQITEDAEVITEGNEYLNKDLPPLRKAKVQASTQSSKSNGEPIHIKQNGETISIYAKRYGETNILIWGHSEYPVMLKVKITKNKTGATYLKFHDYKKKQEKAAVLEKTSHEKVIVVLTKYLYDRETPRGYSSTSSGEEYRNGQIEMKLVRSIIGKNYRGDEWYIKNNYNEIKKFHEEIFYNEGIYSVSLENNILNPGEATRMFIVRRGIK